MNLLARWEAMERDPLNADRIAQFSAPLLRSLDEDAMILGYSIWSHNQAMSSVEVNHVLASSAFAEHPAGVSTRTIAGDEEVDDPLRLHVPSFLVAFDSDWEFAGSDRAGRDRLSREIALIPYEEVSLIIDGEAVLGQGFVLGRWCFWKAVRAGFTWTVAAPSDVAAAGFTTALRPLGGRTW